MNPPPYASLIEENLKCRFCNKAPTVYKIGSVEGQDGYVVSFRTFLLCDDHKNLEDFEKPL